MINQEKPARGLSYKLRKVGHYSLLAASFVPLIYGISQFGRHSEWRDASRYEGITYHSERLENMQGAWESISTPELVARADSARNSYANSIDAMIAEMNAQGLDSITVEVNRHQKHADRKLGLGVLAWGLLFSLPNMLNSSYKYPEK